MRRRIYFAGDGKVLQIAFLRNVREAEARQICRGMGNLCPKSNADNSYYLYLRVGLEEDAVDKIIDRLESNRRVKGLI